jgi:Glycosyltransferase family 87
MSYLPLALPGARAHGLLRLRRLLGRRPAITLALITLLAGWGLLAITHRAPHIAVPKAVAVRQALRDTSTARMLASVRWDRAEVTPMDSHYEVLAFYRGPAMVATVNVTFKGRVALNNPSDLERQKYAYGSNVGNDWRVLTLLSALFVLMAGVWPIRRLRNLDVLVVTSLVLSVVFYNAETLTRMVWVTYPALLYLALRCAWRAFGPEPASDAVPLYDRLTHSWTGARRARVLRLVLAALVLITIMVSLTSPNVLDVGYAVMEGATGIVHGLLPYGHIPDIIHGDTYPIGSYLLYVPLAWPFPVHSVWDNADTTLVVALGGALVMAGALWRMARKRALSERPVSSTEPLRMSICILAFPAMLVTVSTGTTDVALGAMLALALLVWRRPGWGAAILSAAAWFKAAPVAILPLAFARARGRALGAAAAGLLVTSAGMLALIIALGGLEGIPRMLQALGFQFTRSSPHTLWAIVGSVPIQQLVQAGTVAFIVATLVSLRRDPGLADDRLRVAAVAGATLLGVQLAANYWNYMYLAWVAPFVVMALLVEPRLDRALVRKPAGHPVGP